MFYNADADDNKTISFFKPNYILSLVVKKAKFYGGWAISFIFYADDGNKIILFPRNPPDIAEVYIVIKNVSTLPGM